MKRLFFAIPIPAEQKRFLLHSFPQKNFPGIRWVSEGNLHITAHFLGATSEEKLKEVMNKAGSVSESTYPFQLTFESFKTIFKDRKPVMIWAQFQDNIAFNNLCYGFREAFLTDEKRKPLPHLTLARIKQLRQLPFDLPHGKPFSFQVNTVELWESHLDSNEAAYKMISQWKLQAKQK